MSNRFSLWTDWLKELLCWDGLLPCVIWGVPWVLSTLFPNQRGPIEVCAIILPIVGVFVRLIRGMVLIGQTSKTWYRWLSRFVCFLLGITVLCVLDAFVILLNIMPPMPPPKDAWDFAAMALPFAIYFVLVGYALFPETYPSTQLPWELDSIESDSKTGNTETQRTQREDLKALCSL